MDPNSQHQMWSKWTFEVLADLGKLPSEDDCRLNAKRFFNKMFGSTGRAHVVRHGPSYLFEVIVEGPPAHDPEYCRQAKRAFIGDFMFKGFGYSSKLVRFAVKVLAGDLQDGTPPEQWIDLPSIKLTI